MMRVLHVLIISTFFAYSLQAQTIIWQEDFSLPDGTIIDIVPPNQWSRDISQTTLTPPNDYFEVRSSQFSGRDLDGEAVWLSEVIDISGSSQVLISLDVTESGNMEAGADYVRAFYILDGAGEVLFGEQADDISGGPIQLNSSSLSGSTLQVIIRVLNNGSNEIWNFDDVTVLEPADVYSIGSGNWSNTANWSLTRGGPSCGCLPSSVTIAYITSPNTIDYDVTTAILGLQVENGGLLRWTASGGNLNFDQSSTILVESGGGISANGQIGAVIHIRNGADHTITIDDATTGLDLEDLRITVDDAAIIINGSGNVILADDLLFRSTGTTVTNNVTGSFSVGDAVNFNANTINNTLVNNQPMTTGGDIRFNGDQCDVVNNSTMTLGDDILVVNNSDTFNSFTNGANSILNVNEIRLGNAIGFVFSNSGTINQSGNFPNQIQPQNTFENLSGGTWHFGGSNVDPDIQLMAGTPSNLFNYNRGGNQNTIVPQDMYDNLMISGTGTKTFNGAIDINGDLTVTSTLDPSNNAISLEGDLNVSGSINVGTSQFTLDGADQNLTSGGTVFSDVVVAGSGVKSLADDLNVGGQLTVLSELDLSPTNFSLAVAGDLINNGSINSRSGTVEFNGPSDQTLSGSSGITFFDIDVNKAGGQVINDIPVILNGAIEFQTATTFDADGGGSGSFLMTSGGGGDARIGVVPSGGDVVGDVTVQRHLPNTAAERAWRYAGSPLINATVADWKGEVPITGTFNDPSTQAEWPAVPGIVESSPSLYRYDETLGGALNNRYESYPLDGTASNTAALEPGRGYAIYVRSSTAETLDVLGPVNVGDVLVNVTSSGVTSDDGWNLVANPYASPINWDNISLPAGINSELHILDNVNNSGQGQGQYVRYVAGVGTPASYAGEISQGQAFFIRATANSTLTFQENNKTSTAAPQFFRTAAIPNLLRIIIKGNQGFDETAIRFHPDATVEHDARFDAGHLKINQINIASVLPDGFHQSINTQPDNFCDVSIPIQLSGLSPGDYELELYNLESFSGEYRVALVDSYLGSELAINSTTLYPFTSGQQPETYLERFNVRISKALETQYDLQYESELCGEYATLRLVDFPDYQEFWLMQSDSTVQADYEIDGTDLVINLSESHLVPGNNSFQLMTRLVACAVETMVDAFSIDVIIVDKPIISMHDQVLWSSSETGNQWYLNGEILPGENRSQLIPGASGNYSLVVTDRWCSSESDDFPYAITGLDDLFDYSAGNIKIFPNPASDVISFDIPDDIRIDPGVIRVYDITGNLLLTRKKNLGSIASLSLHTLDDGIYFLEIQTDSAKIRGKFVKQ